MGTDNIDQADVAAVLEFGKLPELTEVMAAASSAAGAVKLRQIAAALASKRHLQEALQVIESCSNRNERLNAIRPFVAQLSPNADPEDIRFVASVAGLLGPPQLRILKGLLRDVGLNASDIGINGAGPSAP
jgi:hypothetical protein